MRCSWFRVSLVSLVLSTVAPTSSADLPPQRARFAHASSMRLTKSTHTLSLLDGDRVLATFLASLGPGGPGFKRQEGDQVTPVGRYHVIGHQPSRYRVFLRLDYPNADDRRRFASLRAAGALPRGATIGGDIGIHGTPQGPAFDEEREGLRGVDWTAGCIGVQDDEIDQIAGAVADGTPIDIED